MAGVSEKNLESWLDNDHDIILYERSWNFEVMAGNYIARNTPFAREFLKSWADFEFRQPPGFSSADNGAIHLVLLQELGITNVQKCIDLYKALEESVMNLDPYFEFVACTKLHLGPARNWYIPGKNPGKISILNRFHGFAVDGWLLDRHFTSYRVDFY